MCFDPFKIKVKIMYKADVFACLCYKFCSFLLFNMLKFPVINITVISYISVSGNKVRVCYHLCIRHTLGTVFELHQSSETMHRYFFYYKDKKYV